MTFSARPPAKLNLTLQVGARGREGFHALRSVFLRIGLSDRLTVRQAGEGADGLLLSGIDVPASGNLVMRAVTLLRDRAGVPLPALAVELDKRIPLAAGLGGGSSDAAAALQLAAACWGVGLSAAERLSLAAMLGSDVPFFASGAPAALVEGRGEQVRPLAGVRGRPGLLLFTPQLAISTAAAFAAFDGLAGAPTAAPEVTDELAEAMSTGVAADQLAGWNERLREANDLWPAAVRLEPALAGLRDELERHSGRSWLLTGSGSSLFTFYASAQEAEEAGGRLVADGRLDGLGGRLWATDLEGPDPSWRQP